MLTTDYFLSPQRPEKRPDIFNQSLWLFHWREVPARGHHRPTLEIVVPFCPFARHQDHFLQEHSNTRRRFDHGGTIMRRLPRVMRGLVVVTRRSAVTLRHPI